MRKGILLILIIITVRCPLFSQSVSLQLSGNGEDGYDVEILYGNQEGDHQQSKW